MPWSESEYGRAICDGCCAASKALNWRGRKHLKEIGAYVPKGNRSQMIYCPICIMTKPEAFGGQKSLSMTWDMAETFFESHWYTPVQLHELGYTTRMVQGEDVVEKLDARNKMNEKFGVVEGKAFLPNEAQLDGVTSLQYGSSSAGESSNVFIDVSDGERPAGLGGGKGPAGLYGHRHSFQIKDKPKKLTRSSTMGLINSMKLINALSIDLPFHPPAMLGCGHKRPQRGPEMRMATLDELRQTKFPPRMSQDAQIDLQDVRSDSSLSVASSVAAFKFLELVCDDSGSSVQDDSDYPAPACSSLNLGSADDNDSESSIGSSSFLR